MENEIITTTEDEEVEVGFIGFEPTDEDINDELQLMGTSF